MFGKIFSAAVKVLTAPKVIAKLGPVIGKSVWKLANGKKTLAGGITTALGLGMLFVPGLQTEAIAILVTSVPTFTTGIIHKIHKKKKGKKDEITA